MRRATVAGHEDLLAITPELLAEKASDARGNERRREIHVLHGSSADPCQRMLNAVQPGSYIRPHRHLDPPKDEGIVVLVGALVFVVFDDDGEPSRFLPLAGRGIRGVDFRAGLWHTFFALEPDTVVYEVKAGPFEPTTDKDFAPWAPAEGDPEAAAYLRDLEARFRERGV